MVGDPRGGLPAPQPPPGRVLAALALLALAVRLGIALWTYSIASDSSFYLETAALLAAGRFEDGLLLRDLHPLFPLLVAWTGPFLGGLEAAAWVISTLASSAAVFPVFFLTRTFWSDGVAKWTAFAYAIHPILALESSDALPTGLYLALFLAALAAGASALRSGPWALFPAAGLAAGLAYLTRAEGIVAIALLLAGTVLALARRIRKGASGREWLAFGAGVLVAAAAFNAVALPYVAWLSRKSGKFAITRKGGTVIVDKALGQDARDTDALRKTAPARPYLPTIAKDFSQACFVAHLPFLAIGFTFAGRVGGRWLTQAPLLAAGLAALAPPLLLFALNSYFRTSHRYMLAGVTLLLPWMAAGVLVLVDAARALAARRSWPAWLAYVPAALFLAASVGKAVRPRRADEVTFVEAGRWLAAQGSRKVLTTSPKIAWYGRCDPLAGHDWIGRPREAWKESGADFLVLDEGSERHFQGPEYLRDLERRGFEQAALFDRGGRKKGLTVWIYRAKAGR